ncbi:phage head-tail connector protein [Mediterraneibacter faecis]|uniref:phage head-tail connector protein n=1 Tax=Mediterraneibacter faecis TaxID=592978 RepID=UPI0032C13DAC
MEVDIIKQRIGIASSVTVYDYDIDLYVQDCIMDMRDSGVSEETLAREDSRVVTAVTLYVKAHIGNDRSDTSRYLSLYRQKVSRLILDE